MGTVATFPGYLCKHSSALYKQFLELIVIFHRTLADNPATKGEKSVSSWKIINNAWW